MNEGMSGEHEPVMTCDGLFVDRKPTSFRAAIVLNVGVIWRRAQIAPMPRTFEDRRPGVFPDCRGRGVMRHLLTGLAGFVVQAYAS